jgi:plasmid stabilization system protein ParE
MNIRLLAPAQSELDEAIDWYDQQAPGLGEAFLIETLKVFRLIRQFPEAWHPLGPGVRRCRINRFPYSVIYAQEGDELLVLAIAHQHREPHYWRDR